MYPKYKKVCDEILAIMNTYHEQEKVRGYVGTPGGLEHMGDVWSLFLRWEDMLLLSKEGESDERNAARTSEERA